MDLFIPYLTQIPDYLKNAAAAPEMLRLRDVGMNCGCEYTSFPRFQRLAPYSRFDHSLGVALIVWHFTQDPAQTLAGLLHDIATPVFAHVIDFLKGDYMEQEATEVGTAEIIAASPALRTVLRDLGLSVEDVCDYHRYPIADNHAPKLAADRLEYTLGNCVNYQIRTPERALQYYRDLVVSQNEDGAPELAFQSRHLAEDFAFAALSCSEIYVADEDRWAMQELAELLRNAIGIGVIAERDFFTTESEVIEKLLKSQLTEARWKSFRAMKMIERSETPKDDSWKMIRAKKRRIDPLIAGYGRVSEYSQKFSEKLSEFENRSQDYWIRARARR